MALLGEKLAQLFDPAPDVDPEDVFNDNTTARNEIIHTGIDVELNPSRIRDIDLGDSYRGQVISRDKLNEWDDGNDHDIDMEYDDESNDTNLDNNESQSQRVIPVFESDEDDDLHENQPQTEVFDTLFEDENEAAAGITTTSVNKPNKHSLDRFNDFSSMMNKQMDKAEELQKQQQHLKVISNKKDGKPQGFQLRKAKAVAAQTKLYDKVATLRIHLQKPLQLARKLPRPSVHCELMKDIDDKPQRRKLKRLFHEISNKALSIADNVMQIQSKLLVKNEEYPDELRYRKRRRLNQDNDSSSNDTDGRMAKKNGIQFDDLWNEMNEDWSDFLPFCNKTMDIWDKKMKLVESHSSKRDRNSHEQSLLERIALIIENPQRILHKMQSVDKLFRMYGDDVRTEDKIEIADDDIHKKDERIRSGTENVSRLKFEKYRMECEVFNDSQFYRRMLKEIIDIGHAATFNAEEIHKKMDQMQCDKQKQKLAFHKAKLRMKYTIRPDMENFLAPIYNHDPDFPVEQLYNSLFQ